VNSTGSNRLEIFVTKREDHEPITMKLQIKAPRNIICALILNLLFGCLNGSLADGGRFSLVSPDVVRARLGAYAGNDRQREMTLKMLFEEAGCEAPLLSKQSVPDLKEPNVICRLPGSTGQTILVGAHFDHVADGSGGVDNWSSASLLPSLYAALKNEPREHTYIFIGFAGEEKGLVGSHFYAQRMSKEEIAMTDAMVNMDTLGLAPPEVWASHSDKLLTNVLAYVAKQMNIPLHGVNVEDVGSTDGESFAAKKIKRITIHSLTQETWNAHILHTYRDQIGVINFDDLYLSYRLVAAYLTFLDQLSDQGAAKLN
jgi:hypothetical protein